MRREQGRGVWACLTAPLTAIAKRSRFVFAFLAFSLCVFSPSALSLPWKVSDTRSDARSDATTLRKAEVRIIELRRACALATQSMEQAEKMVEDFENVTESEPLAYGYRAMAEFLVGHHSYNPVTKMRRFTSGREVLERAVQAAPEMTELRYLRFTIQSRLPGVLPYREHLQPDKEHLMRFLRERRKGEDEELTGNIRAALLASELCTPDEKTRLRK
ncbi:MAG: hypothetical protein ACKOB6_01070 [Candidatus Kapaibacterium sp.]